VRKLITFLAAVMAVLLLPAPSAWASLQWHIEPTPFPANATGAALARVSCISSDFCVAVGRQDIGHSAGLAQVYTGGSWALSALPSVPGNSYQADVSCTTSSACTAVGYTVNSGAGTPVAMRWNGTAWSLQTLPVIAGSTDTELRGVSCVAGFAWCMAVGWSSNGALALKWNGTTWSQTALPATVAGDRLTGVSCTKRTACTAVGQTASGQALIERWNSDSTWSTQSAAHSSDRLSRVSCVSTTFCVAVGFYLTSHLVSDIETWNGVSWFTSMVGDYFRLDDVSCVTATNCMTVGSTQSSPISPVAYRWDGSTWTTTVVPVPTGSTATVFGGVACPTTTLCRAVGYWAPTSDLDESRPLAERWS
jgi:hypothetical protein